MKHISDSDNLDQGEKSYEDLTDELVDSTALILKRYEESRANGVRRAQIKGSNLTRRSSYEKRNSCNFFNYGSPDNFSRGYRRRKKPKALRTMKSCTRSWWLI